MSGREEARRLVEGIFKDHGGISQEILDRIPNKDDRDAILTAMLNKDKLIASSVTTLAKNLYSSNARFVFELLQNCDDNLYRRARANGVEPAATFKVHPDRIVLECNEDGFRPENLTAICSVGKSSKSGAQGYIGEKGIGFKSVFMAAYKVQVQSGDYSFYFQHKNGDSGMGMITPVWNDHDENPMEYGTRFTLFLHTSGDASTQTKQQQTIWKQFEDLQETILLFLKNIKEIKIHFYNNAGNRDHSTHYFTEKDTNSTVSVHRVKDTYTGRTGSNGRVSQVKYYHITRYTATNLAANENRTYSDDEKQTKAYSNGEVVLAFPLTMDAIPVREDQSLFAFLPVREMRFKFLIQADFVTEASRQNIVMTSARNEGLLQAVAEAFMEAILQFNVHATLRYQWMRFLPQAGECPSDDLWKRFVDRIEKLLKETAVLHPAKPAPLRRLAECRQQVTSTLDKNGLPLLADLTPGLYLSPGYEARDLSLLKKHGLACISMAEVIDRAENDLRSAQSRIKSTEDEDWQRRLSYLLDLPFREPYPDQQERVKALAVVPLRNGKWASIQTGPIYYPCVARTQLDIPQDLSFDVVDPKAVENTARKSLFDSIGVQAASVALVRSRVFQKHREGFSMTRTSANYELRFLYLTQHLDTTPNSYEAIYLGPESGNYSRPRNVDIYLRNNDPYGAAELLRDNGQTPKEGAPNLDVKFLHGLYLQDPPPLPTPKSLPWQDWLQDSFGVRLRPRLMNRDKSELSDICRYVAEHRPEKFLGYLQANWEFGDPPTAIEKERIQELSKLAVLCESGEMRPLESTYLPTDALKQLCGRFLQDEEFFPWLQLDIERSWQTFPAEWVPLGKTLGLGFNKPELNFLLDILRHLRDANQNDCFENPKRVCELYVHIQSEIRKSVKIQDSRQLVRSFVRETSTVFVPEGEMWDPGWALPSQCVWDAPFEMESTHSLSPLYEMNVKGSGAELAKFFTDTLEIPRFGWTQVVEEIRHIKTERRHSRRLYALYTCVANRSLLGISKEEMKKTFQCEALIGKPHREPSRPARSWHTTDQCLWSSGIKIKGRLVLKDLYPELEDFFVKQLGVQSMTAEMVYQELRQNQTSVDDAKQKIQAFNSLLTVENCGKDFAGVYAWESRIFPVRLPNGDVEIVNGEDDFFISDRQSLSDAFAGKASLLDFALNEFHTMMPFFKWVGIEDRCLSHQVQEVSSVDPSSARPISSTRRDVRRRAHALLSIASSYHSPRTRGNKVPFYNLLRKLETLETNAFISELRLKQGNHTLVAKKEAPMLHIAEDDATIRIYVPQNRSKQALCFNTELPKRLSEWLMTKPGEKLQDPVTDKMVNVVLTVLNVEGTASLAAALEHNGIVPVTDPPPHEEELKEQDEDVEEQESEAFELSRPSAPVRDGGNSTDSSGEEMAEANTPPSSISSPSARRTPVPETISHVAARSNFNHASSRPRVQAVHSVIPIASSGSDDYTDLLRNVVRAARRFAFPSKGTFDMSAVQMALSNVLREEDDGGGEPYKLRSSSQLERDKQVGAAGELFAFEVLSRLDPSLPGFSRANWQSTIRSYVRQHPDYLDLEAWNGRETADITYKDDHGKLMDLLIDKGYLASATWAGARLHFYIEVKTTTGPCEMPFYMSKHQYARMQKYSSLNTNSRATEGLYVVFRVFNLGKDSVGLRVLVDPESMRQRGELAFTAETWSVVTGA